MIDKGVVIFLLFRYTIIKPLYTQVTGIIVWLSSYGLSAWIDVR